MSFAPHISELLARARADLRMGLPIVLNGPDGAILAISAEVLTAERLADLRELDSEATLAITARRAETLKARPYDGDLARVILPQDADLTWIESVANPADDLRMPLKGPLVSARSGSAELHRLAIKMAKSARLLPAAVTVELPNGHEFAARHGLTLIEHADAAPHLLQPGTLHEVVSARLPIEVSEASRLYIYRPDDGGEEHYAIEIGRPDRAQPVLARLHSACFTGDVMGSLKCDCPDGN